MPYAPSGPINLYYEETGDGYPILFIHEFAGDWRSWEPQVRYFSRRYRCITYCARGYPPSDVPEDGAQYGQDLAVEDARNVLVHLDIPRAHIVGLSMGGFCTVHFGMRHPEMARSLVIAGCGYGAPPGDYAAFQATCRELAESIETQGMAEFSKEYALAPGRLGFKAKDPRGHAEFAAQLAEHSTIGSAMHMRHVQGERPSLWDFEADLARLPMPALIVNGDEDEPCLEAGLFLKRTIPDAGHWVLPRAGHTMNIEEPALFNQGVERFLAEADARSPA